jgi:hypothetical protein
MDPLRFNYLLHLWYRIRGDIVEQIVLDNFERDLSYYVKQQKQIDKLKKEVGCA